ncbi:MAG: phenylacetate--CoA ligase family protein [Pseudomonadota bacterium]
MKAFLRRNIVEPAWAKFWSKTPMLKYHKKLEATQWLSEDELRKQQWSKLKNLLKYVYENNIFYKEKFDKAGISYQNIETLEDMKKIPMTTKLEIKNNYDRIISNGYRKDTLLRTKTGGSTGTALELFRTQKTMQLKQACTRRSDMWSGWKPGETIGSIWGNPEHPSTLKEHFRNLFISPYIYLDTMKMNKESVIEFSKKWERKKVSALFGHSHSIYLLAKFVKELKIDKIKPKNIISTSMMLMPYERQLIENVFGVKVFDRYGCEEVSLIASQCDQHDGMHINIEHLLVEFIKPDGSDAKPGEEGGIVVTDLLNTAMPMVRYKVEDIGVPSNKKCECGRGLPLMEKVVGRTADFLVHSDGSLVAGVSLIERTLTAIKGLVQMQIIQETCDKITLKIVEDSSFNEQSRKELFSEFKKVFGDDLILTIKSVNTIPQERSGKYRFSITKVNQ